MENSFEIAVRGLTPAESQRLAQELEANLKVTHPGLRTSRKKDLQRPSISER